MIPSEPLYWPVIVGWVLWVVLRCFESGSVCVHGGWCAAETDRATGNLFRYFLFQTVERHGTGVVGASVIVLVVIVVVFGGLVMVVQQ